MRLVTLGLLWLVLASHAHAQTPIAPFKTIDNKKMIKQRDALLQTFRTKFLETIPGSKEEAQVYGWITRARDYRPDISLTSTSGDVGYSDMYYRVTQVIDRENAIVDLYNYRRQRVPGRRAWLTSKTKDLAEGDLLSSKCLIQIDGTKTYTSVLGAKTTLPNWVAVSMKPMPLAKLPDGVDMKRKPASDEWHIQKVDGSWVPRLTFVRVRKGVVYFNQHLLPSGNRIFAIPVKQLKPRYQEWVHDKLKRKKR